MITKEMNIQVASSGHTKQQAIGSALNQVKKK
ncbi:hypothetical protein SAMN05878482_10781 [Peribacillus simplex]|uniref:Uncharacterized protein n=1 Tax=Peribacillus simplex TaxID=1478 RepID=A0A9X8RCQ1_9BACI|nr:hypothetical protein SAMN05878482_10781 [Peribacillus simplex]